MGSEEKEKTAVNTLQHQDCEECRLNIEIIGVNDDLISKQILQGMEKSGESLVMMTTEGSNHVGIYKLPPRPLH
jgi:hypothetical protein